MRDYDDDDARLGIIGVGMGRWLLRQSSSGFYDVVGGIRRRCRPSRRRERENENLIFAAPTSGTPATIIARRIHIYKRTRRYSWNAPNEATSSKKFKY